MAVLDDIKTLLNISDTSQDNVINLYIRKATTLIANYLNIPTTETTETDIYGNTTTIEPIDIPTTYPDAVAEYVIECFNKRGNEGIKQFTQGSRGGTYENGLSDAVKSLLPVPYATMVSARWWDHVK